MNADAGPSGVTEVCDENSQHAGHAELLAEDEVVQVAAGPHPWQQLVADGPASTTGRMRCRCESICGRGGMAGG